MRRSILTLSLMFAMAGGAAADKLDDAIKKADTAWDRAYDLQVKAADLYKKWETIHKPSTDQWEVVKPLKATMQRACAPGASKACTDATVAWAAAQKLYNSLAVKAEAEDPKNQYAASVVSKAQADSAAATRDRDAAVADATKLIVDARAKARTKADRDKIDAKLATREQKRGDAAAEMRGSKAEARNPNTGNSNSNSQGSSGSTPSVDAAGIINSTTSRW